MRAAFITAKETVELRDTDQPEPQPGEVLVRVRACGICGSDLHFYHGAFPVNPNLIPGHEFSGEIAAVGEGVSGWDSGDRVCIEPIRYCQTCEYCRSGRYHICPSRLLGGSFSPGALADYIATPTYTLYRLPDEIDFEIAALVEPLAVSVHGVHIVGLKAGERVLVIGSGTIGLMAVLAARDAGADVVATYRHDHQGEAALAMGASRVVKDDDTRGLEKEGFDVVIETVGGTAPTISHALGIVRPGGRVSVLGVFSGAATINALGLVLKEVTLVGGITYCRPGLHSDFDVALGILARESNRARSIITHRYPLDEVSAAFVAAADKSSKSVKVHVTP